MMHEHSADYCARGLCAHAVSVRVPCRCPDCDLLASEMVRGYREQQEARAKARVTQAEGAERGKRRHLKALDDDV